MCIRDRYHTTQMADGQRRQQHPEVCAACRAVQQANAQCGVRVPVFRTAKVRMDVRVADPGVGVFVRMNFSAQPRMQTKRTNRNQQHPHQTLCPSGKALDHGGVFQQPKEHPDNRHTGRMAQSPPEAKPPSGSVTVAGGERCQRSQMIRPGDHMGKSRNKSNE